MKTLSEEDLPLEDLRKVGLFTNGKLNLEKEAIDALLAGRRTELISLKNLKTDGFQIEQLDAKLSLFQSETGRISLNVHPIYKEAQKHGLLTEEEAGELVRGDKNVIRKFQNTREGEGKVHIIEYDAETREFVSYEPDSVLAPEKVNGESLSRRQKEGFRHGEIIELSDGTQFQHRATEPKGLRSDASSLVVSLLLDGGISYLLLKGIRSLSGADGGQRGEFSKGYYQTLPEMEKSSSTTMNVELNEASQKNQHSRGYGHSASR